MRPWTRALILACAAAAAAPAGCARREEAASPAAAAALCTEVERGPVRVVVELAPAEPRLSDEPVLVLTVDAEQEVEVALPPFGETVGGLAVRSFREPPAQVAGGRRVLTQQYVLEPVRTGEHVIRPIRVTFRDTRPGGDGAEHALETEELKFAVTSLLEGEAPRLEDVRPPAAPLAIPVAARPPWAAVLAGGAAVLLLCAALVFFRRRRRRVLERPPSPAEQALAELRRLVEDDPLARGDLQTFYVELTGIVRRYIERTTGVRAPEQTTAEFLRAMRGHAAFGPEERQRLAAFLESADLVKFAAHRPERGDIEEAFRRAQEFVGLAGALPLAREKVA